MSVNLNKVTLNSVTVGTVVATPVAPSVYTVYGDEYYEFPFISLPAGEHLKTYVAGYFSVGADLANITPADIRCGVTYYGDANGGTATTYLDGVQVDSRTLVGAQLEAYFYVNTSYEGETILFGDKQPITSVGFDYDVDSIYRDYGWGEVGFDNKDVKHGWYVHTSAVTAAGGLPIPGAQFYCNMPMSYTARIPVNPHTPWVNEMAPDVPTGAETFDYTFYDTPTTVSYNINIGGYVPSWQSTPAGLTVNDLPWFDWGSNMPVTQQTEVWVDGGILFANGDIDTWRNSESFVLNGANAAQYWQQGNVTGGSVTVGLRTYSGMSATKFAYGSFFQAMNFGEPVLFETWYSNNP